jgi:hypothetical protein
MNMAEKERRLPLLLYAAILIVVGAAVLFAFLAVVLGIQPPEIPGVTSSGGSGSSPTENASSIAKENLLPYMPPTEVPAVKENEILVRFTIAFAVENTVKGEPLEGTAESLWIPLPAYAERLFSEIPYEGRLPLHFYDLKFSVYYENKTEFENFRVHLFWENEWSVRGIVEMVDSGNVVSLYGGREKAPEIKFEDVPTDRQFGLGAWLKFQLSEIYPGETLVIHGRSILLISEENLKIVENLSLVTLIDENSAILLNFIGGPASIKVKAVLEGRVGDNIFLVEKWAGENKEQKTFAGGIKMIRYGES